MNPSGERGTSDITGFVQQRPLGARHMTDRNDQAPLTSDGRPIGECWFKKETTHSEKMENQMKNSLPDRHARDMLLRASCNHRQTNLMYEVSHAAIYP
jgi:hypothetical protein